MLSSTTSYRTGGYANGRARLWWKCFGSTVQFLHPRIRPALTRTPCHGYYPFCPCWHPLVLSPGVDHSPLVNYRCRTLYSTTAVSDITFFSQAIYFIDKYGYCSAWGSSVSREE